MIIHEIKISKYLDATSRDGYNIIPERIRVLFEVGKCKDWIELSYIIPTNEGAILNEIQRILFLEHANPEPKEGNESA